MRFRSKDSDVFEADLTPMIDMTFQLIAFFMVLINFTQTDQNERIQLPKSALAKPPDQPLDYPIILHVTRDGSVLFSGNELATFSQLRPYLTTERAVLEGRGKTVDDSTVIIRAHRSSKTGRVQELIAVCQDVGFERFALRAIEEIGN